MSDWGSELDKSCLIMMEEQHIQKFVEKRFESDIDHVRIFETSGLLDMLVALRRNENRP